MMQKTLGILLLLTLAGKVWAQIVFEKEPYALPEEPTWEETKNISPDAAIAWLEENEDTIDWEAFMAWIEDVKDKKGYEWISTEAQIWKEKEQEEKEEEEIHSDDIIMWADEKWGGDEQKGDVDPKQFHLYLVKNTAKIDWDEFNEWVEKVKNEPGYEWLPEAYEGWEDDEELPWSEVEEDIEQNKWDLNADEMKEWFDDNEQRIDWDHFYDWADDVEDEPGYEWLYKVLRKWKREDESEDVPEDWIRDDGKIKFEKIATYLEKHKTEVDADETREWFEDHDHLIDWDEFDAWAAKVGDSEGYEWLSDILAVWEEDDKEKAQQKNRKKDGMLDWDNVAKSIDKKKDKMTAADMAKWLKANENKIDRDEFDDWVEEVEDEEGYEWLDEAIEKFKLWDEYWDNADESGEDVCENRDYGERTCLVMGCCQWDGGKCQSDVGRDYCSSSQAYWATYDEAELEKYWQHGKNSKRGGKNGGKNAKKKDGKKKKGKGVNSQGQATPGVAFAQDPNRRWKDENDRQKVPLWAACALTGLSVAVFALFLGLCFMYRHFTKAIKQASTPVVSTGVPMPVHELAVLPQESFSPDRASYISNTMLKMNDTDSNIITSNTAMKMNDNDMNINQSQEQSRSQSKQIATPKQVEQIVDQMRKAN